MLRPVAQRTRACVGFEGPPESHTLPSSGHDPGGSYGHQTKLNGRGKGREYNSLSQNYMNPQNSGISAHAFQGPKGRISLGRTGEEESYQCPLGRCLCPWDTGFGYQCKANLSTEEEGPLPPPPTGASFEVGGAIPAPSWSTKAPLSDCGDGIDH